MSIEARLRKKLKHFTLDVSLTCQEGRLLAIVGPSGAGKTTIVRMLAGLERPDEGTITCRGETWTDIQRKILLPARKRGVGYVFQEFTLFPHLNVYRNVAFAAKDDRTVEELLRQFDIWHLRDSRPHLISGGERQRCAICQALAREPKVLFMDEPFSALDALNRRNLRGMLKALKHELRIPVIHITHDIREALFLADDLLPVVQGRVQNKWLLQFLFSAREALRCGGHSRMSAEEGSEEIELPMRSKEYLR
ncbi:MAG: ATP-binding cassette domain-containing protein [Desulfobacterota bacterium]|jgi:molybdate transport system ATP-binding protein|nr:ATP-binding cassette domain-containing protein [Thermodesulfobacteriota bacterium]